MGAHRAPRDTTAMVMLGKGPTAEERTVFLRLYNYKI